VSRWNAPWAHGIGNHQESSSGVGGHLSSLFLCFVIAVTDLSNQSIDHQKENDHNEGEIQEDGVDTIYIIVNNGSIGNSLQTPQDQYLQRKNLFSIKNAKFTNGYTI
jgi:hypothetical protein